MGLVLGITLFLFVVDLYSSIIDIVQLSKSRKDEEVTVQVSLAVNHFLAVILNAIVKQQPGPQVSPFGRKQPPKTVRLPDHDFLCWLDLGHPYVLTKGVVLLVVWFIQKATYTFSWIYRAHCLEPARLIARQYQWHQQSAAVFRIRRVAIKFKTKLSRYVLSRIPLAA